MVRVWWEVKFVCINKWCKCKWLGLNGFLFFFKWWKMIVIILINGMVISYKFVIGLMVCFCFWVFNSNI